MISCEHCNYKFQPTAVYPIWCKCGAVIDDPKIIKGAGDLVARATSAVGVKPCGGCNKRKKKLNAVLPKSEPARIITLKEASRLSQELSQQVPIGSVIVGIPRSGMIPASIIATHTHSHLFTVHNNMISEVGHGMRFSDLTGEVNHVFVVDDSAYSGRAMHNAVATVEATFPQANIKTMVLISSREAVKEIDVFSRCMDIHYFEWNYPNAPFSKTMGFDLDGTLCRDFRPEEDDDGRRYVSALDNMTPSMIRPKKYPLRVITARLERYRGRTERWLSKYGYDVESLVMGPWKTKQERESANIAQWKADKFLELKLTEYIESNPKIAKHMASILPYGKVACNTTGEIFITKKG